MSSRALRKAQKELEEKRKLEQLKAEEDALEQSEVSEDESLSVPKSGFSAFALLNEDDENDKSSAEENSGSTIDERETSESTNNAATTSPKPLSKSAKKKKKKKKVKDRTAPTADPDTANDKQLDEIDRILRQLSQEVSQKDGSNSGSPITGDGNITEAFEAISIDAQHLHASNEMRRLFGRAAMEDDRAQNDAGRRRGRGQPQAGIGAAVAGRRGGGGTLTSIALRRNIFIQGKEEWPQAGSGGLGMEILGKDANGVTTFSYVHSRAYQDVQRQFNACVETGDPQQMVNHLAYNPYHISTLLQVSEIAKNMERDHATAGDLLERALFALGRSVHSTFAKSLAQGKARLDFQRAENRELWLAGWRYIENLSMRATWRTVFEWAKMLFSLAPDRDPYCMRLVIDQYAVRARQWEQLGSLYRTSPGTVSTQTAYSYGLALFLSGDSQAGRKELKQAIESKPWIANRLFQALNLEPIPPAVWGKQPPTALDNLFSELYAVRAKDIWNTPEATSLLMSVAHTASKEATAAASVTAGGITLDIARHVLLSDNREILALVPREFTNRLTSASDPLPPDDAISTYSTAPRDTRGRRTIVLTEDMTAQIQQLQQDIENLGRHGLRAGDDDDDDDGDAAPPPQVGDGREDVAGRQTRLQQLAADLQRFMQNGGNGEVLVNLLQNFNLAAPNPATQNEVASDDEGLPGSIPVSDEEEDASNPRRARVEDAEDED